MYRAPVIGKSLTTGAIDDRMIATMRVTLAASALLIIYLDPSEPNRFVSITYAALILYTLYSAILAVLAFRQNRAARLVQAWSHWADVGWYLLLISLSSGTSSVFFFFFFFSILVASFRWGFASGLRVAIVSSILFSLIGYVAAPSGTAFELNRSLLRPIGLLVLGYMMAYWGGSEVTLKRRLALLKEITRLSNPRFGVNRTVAVIMEQLRTFYQADACLLILDDPDTGGHQLRRADRRGPQAGGLAERINGEAARQLLALPRECAVIYSGHFKWWSGRPLYYAFDISTGERTARGREACQALAALLEAESLVTVPLHQQSAMTGRVFLTSHRPYAFNRVEADFLTHVYEQIMPVIENIRLVDRLASDAAEHERQKIARDIHDSVIQPYVGLQIGLSAVDQKLNNGDPDVGADVRRLLELTRASISEMRQYVQGLKASAAYESSLLPSVRRFAARFVEATGIHVQVEAASDIQINDRLAAEVFQMIAEGLSNVRRHTHARQATVALACHGSQLILQIENEFAEVAAQADFRPGSIAERAAALGGHLRVEQRDGRTVVVIDIPL